MMLNAPVSSNDVVTPIGISGTYTSPQIVTDGQGFPPFGNVTITDANPGASDTATITLAAAGAATDANGTLTGAGLAKTATGTYTLTAASPAAEQAELRALVFTPGLTVSGPQTPPTTGLTLQVSDGIAPVATDTKTVIDAAPGSQPLVIGYAAVPNEPGFFTSETRTASTTYDATPVNSVTNAATTTITGVLNGGQVYQQSFATVFSDPAVQAAIAQLDAMFAAEGATSSAPALTSSEVSLQNAGTTTVVTGDQTGAPSATVSTNFGPETPFPTATDVNGTPGSAFTLLAGQVDTNVNYDYPITIDETVTSTGTQVTSQQYVITGVTTVSGGGPSGTLPDVQPFFTAAIYVALQSTLSSLTPVGATPNVVSVAAAGSTAPPVPGTLNALVATAAASGVIALPTGFAAGYLLGAATLQDMNGNAELIATAAGGTLIGAAADTLFGGNAGVTLTATSGAETLIGGTGATNFFLGASTAFVESQGSDLITGSSGAETVNASGSVLYFGATGATTLNETGAGVDTLIGGNNGNTITGGGGNQLIFGSSSLDFIGGAGAATIIGGGNGNTITGGSGNVLAFASSALTYTGTIGAATLIGGGGPMNVNLGTGGGVVYGSPNGGDTLASGSGLAIMVGGGQGDVLTASGTANDTLVAGGGAETLNGAASSGNLVLFGGPGDDELVGGTGGNLFIAESGNETLVGGGSSDSTIFIATAGTTRTDVMVNFNPSVDAIGLFGYGGEPGADAAALASATVAGGNTVVSLTDGTTILFTGAPTLNSYNFF